MVSLIPIGYQLMIDMGHMASVIIMGQTMYFA